MAAQRRNTPPLAAKPSSAAMLRSALTTALPGLLTLALLVLVVFTRVLPAFEENLMESKRKAARELTSTAWSVLDDYAARVPDEMSLADAQIQAMEIIRAMRYGPEGKDYFWINDMHPNLIMHPYRTELEGTDVSDFEDQAGKALFVEFVNTVQSDGSGFVDYLWWWKDSERIEPKLSYVMGFEPWDWIIGTGIYIEDVQDEIAGLRRAVLATAGLVLVFVSLLLLLMIRQAWLAQRKRAEAETTLRESEAKFRGIFDRAFQFMFLLDVDGLLLDVNKTALEYVGARKTQVLGHRFWDTPWWLSSAQGRERLQAAINECIEGVTARFQADGIRGVDRIISVDCSAKPILDDGGDVARIVIEARDVTTMIELQEQLRQSQKMEAVGQLAGGVAHDFNNLLTGIIGNAQMLHDSLPQDTEKAELCEEVLIAASRSADLTRQLLSFSRKGQLQNKPLNMHALIEEVIRLLKRSIDRRIEIHADLDAANAFVRGDPTMLQNALLNLGVNARDAMSKLPPEANQKNVLSFLTHDVVVNGDFLLKNGLELAQGRYLVVTISDTGVGISPEDMEHIFEPFFSTKPTGEGTGLGLASVYGCIQSHLGTITVTSKPRQGTTFTIYLPEVAAVATEPEPRIDHVHEGGHILVVEDDEILMKTITKALKSMGYEVSGCPDGLAGVEFFMDNHKSIDLVILDLIMPRMSGEEAFQRLMAIDPTTKVLISSGYSRNRAVEDLIAAGACGFLSKPYQLEKLSSTVAGAIRTREKT